MTFKANKKEGFFKYKSLFVIFLGFFLISCGNVKTVSNSTEFKSISLAQSDIGAGVIAAQQKKYQEAVNLFSLSIDKNPKIPEAYYYRGKAYQKLNLYIEAQQDYYKALKLNARYPEVHNSLGVLYTSQGEYRDAIDSYTIAISFNPRYAKPHINRGVVYFREGSYQKALFDFTRALEIEPRSTLALKNRANVFSRMGADHAVCDDLEQLCSLGDCLSFDKLKKTGYCNN